MMTVTDGKVNKKQSPFSIQLAECALAVISILFSFIVAGKLIYNDSFPFGFLDGILIYTVISSLGVIMLGVNKYFSFLDRNFVEITAKIFGIVILLNFTFIALLYFSKSLRLSFYYFVVADVFLFFFLFLIKRITSRMKQGILRERLTLVIGKNRKQNPILKALNTENRGRLAFAPYDHPKLEKYLERADNIYLSGTLSKKIKEQVISYCVLKDKKIFVVPETYEIAMRKSEMTQVSDIPVFSIDSFRLTEAQTIVKRTSDILLALIGIIFTSPLMLFAVIRIKLEDGGPIFYKQERSGLKGRVFHVIKFRSMVVDAEKYTGAVFAAENDPRITKIGKLMRATRIDEIPQFFNVLLGSMSLVGPRPERPVFVEEFCRDLPEFSNRLAVKPGITGLAQVMGNYTTSAYNKVKFDLVYIRNYSLWLDIKILLKTVQVVFRKEQAEGFAKHGDMDLEDALNADDILVEAPSTERRKKSQLGYRLAKVTGVTFCCLLIISGSVFLRYSALAMTMLEATIPEQVEGGLMVEHAELLVSQQNQDLAIAAFGRNVDGADEQQTDKDASQGTNDPSSADADSKDEQRMVLTGAEIEAALKQITLKEKLTICLDFLSKLDTADLMYLEKLAANGFNEREKDAAKTLMYQRFDHNEVAYIKMLYREYVEQELL